MAWSTIRKATARDNDNMARASVRFCERHNIDWMADGLSSLMAIDMAIDAEEEDCRAETQGRLAPYRAPRA